MSKEQTSAIIGIVLSAAIALLAVFGYNVMVVEPKLDALEAQIAVLAWEPPAGGVTNFDSLELAGDITFNGGVYPVGTGASGLLYEAGRRANVTKAAITPMAISTVEAYGCTVVNPVATGGWHCGAQIGAGNRITMTVYNLAATPVPTAQVRDVNFWVSGK